MKNKESKVTLEKDESINLQNCMYIFCGYADNENPVDLALKDKIPEGLVPVVVNYSPKYGTISMVFRDFSIGFIPDALFDVVEKMKKVIEESKK